MFDKDVVDRFWKMVDRTGGMNSCWIWTGHKWNQGYGCFKIKGMRYKAHRISYAIANSNLPPKDVFVCHRCDNPSCVNPRHLFLGSVVVNTADRDAKGRQIKGEQVNTCKLQESDVKQIRAEYATGEYRQVDLAAKYGVSQVQIGHIVRRQHWKHI